MGVALRIFAAGMAFCFILTPLIQLSGIYLQKSVVFGKMDCQSAQLETIVFENCTRKYEVGDEFELNGEMYDVIAVKNSNKSVMLTVFPDRKESFFKNFGKSKPANSKWKYKEFKWIQDIVFCTAEDIKSAQILFFNKEIFIKSGVLFEHFIPPEKFKVS